MSIAVRRCSAVIALTLTFGLGWARGQAATQPPSIHQVAPLDPTRTIQHPALESAQHTPLPEEYIWPQSDVTVTPATLFVRSHLAPILLALASLLTGVALILPRSRRSPLPSPTASDTGQLQTSRNQYPTARLIASLLLLVSSAGLLLNLLLAYRHTRNIAETQPHYFRDHFIVSPVPQQATLYIVGPRSLQVWINGQLAQNAHADMTSPLSMHVFTADVARFLRPGENTIAIEATRGHGTTGDPSAASAWQQLLAQVLVVKLLPAPRGVEAPALLLSGSDWKGSNRPEKGWQSDSFRDLAWQPVQSLGGIESSIEFFQWNADAGLYNWPGYDGISSFMAHLSLLPTAVVEANPSQGSFENQASLIGQAPGDLTVRMPASNSAGQNPPGLLLDFGRELTGRVQIVSNSGSPLTLSVQMGESEAETTRAPYLGVNQLTLAPHAAGFGPKSAFRFALVRFLAGAPQTAVHSITVDHIFYPVQYLGSFQSSDALLNRIWEVGAYTAHLCMQDGVWDGAKRDRGRWMGDVDVSGRVIEDVFGEEPLMEDTLDRLLSPAPIARHVNGIAGYSAAWINETADFYRHTGDKAFLERKHELLLQLLHFVDRDFNPRHLFVNKSRSGVFVDWSPDLSDDTAESRRATTLEFIGAFRQAAWILRALGDEPNAAKYEARAEEVKAAANKYLTTPETGTFGPRWQTNAAAVLGGAAGPERDTAIWNKVLSQVGQASTHGLVVTPYANYYIIQAMARLGHRQQALAWIRQYWGGMLQEGATSFWEAYDLDWPRQDFHAGLEADNTRGYYVSLAHGWSAGPTAWLMEEVLGIQPTGPGFATVSVRPDLLDLQWAAGTEPTPTGPLRVTVRKQGLATRTDIDLPPGVAAQVSVPSTQGALSLNGLPVQGVPAENGTRRLLTLDHAGHYELLGQ